MSSRRRFVSSAGLAALGTILLRPFLDGAPAEGRSLPDKLAGLFGDAAGREAVGRAYLDGAPEEAGAAILVRRILEAGELSPETVRGASRTLLRDALVRQIRDDYRAGRMVQVDGWLLSATEARLCALSYVS